jgi:hypothetical protein
MAIITTMHYWKLKQYIDWLFWKRLWFRIWIILVPLWMIPVFMADLAGAPYSSTRDLLCHIYCISLLFAVYDHKNVGNPPNPFKKTKSCSTTQN